MFIEILFKMLLFKGDVLIYAEHCIYSLKNDNSMSLASVFLHVLHEECIHKRSSFRAAQTRSLVHSGHFVQIACKVVT